MADTPIREVIAQTIWESEPGRDPADSWADWRDLAIRSGNDSFPYIQADAVRDALSALTDADVDEAIGRFERALAEYERVWYSRANGYGEENEITEAEREREAALLGLRAIIAMRGRGVMVTEDDVVVNRGDLAYVLLDWSEAATNAPPIHGAGGTRSWWGVEDQEVYDRLQSVLAAKEQEARNA